VPISASYNPGTGIQTINHSSQSGLLSSSFAKCPLDTYEIITDQTTGALLVGTAVTVDISTVYIDTS
jgi:hypothetical protein